VGKRDNIVDVGVLEFCVREHLNKIALRRMVVFDPLKITISNYPEGKTEMLSSENNPEDPEGGLREMPFSKEIFIEQEDFMEEPPKKYFRLAPGQMVRLKSAFILRCDEVQKDGNGNITGLVCHYFPDSKSGEDTSGLKVQGTLHWVNAATAISCEIREYDRLFRVEDPSSEEGDFKEYLNPDSLRIIGNAMAEPALGFAGERQHYQFLRKGYFTADSDSKAGKLVFNRTVGLKDAWAKEQKKA
jgi:glutaminyl-tRNA synthetase